MSYYDDPQTFLNAKIASQKSILIDQIYSYKKVITTIATTPIDVIDVSVFTQAQNMIGSIQNQKIFIQDLENKLNFILVEPVIEPVVEEQTVIEPVVEEQTVIEEQIVIQPVVEEQTLIEEQTVIEPVVDLSGNPT